MRSDTSVIPCGVSERAARSDVEHEIPKPLAQSASKWRESDLAIDLLHVASMKEDHRH